MQKNLETSIFEMMRNKEKQHSDELPTLIASSKSVVSARELTSTGETEREPYK